MSARRRETTPAELICVDTPSGLWGGTSKDTHRDRDQLVNIFVTFVLRTWRQTLIEMMPIYHPQWVVDSLVTDRTIPQGVIF